MGASHVPIKCLVDTPALRAAVEAYNKPQMTHRGGIRSHAPRHFQRPKSGFVHASADRHERESRLMALGCRGRFLRLTEPARVVRSGATSSSSSGRGTERIGTLRAWRRRSARAGCVVPGVRESSGS